MGPGLWGGPCVFGPVLQAASEHSPQDAHASAPRSCAAQAPNRRDPQAQCPTRSSAALVARGLGRHLQAPCHPARWPPCAPLSCVPPSERIGELARRTGTQTVLTKGSPSWPHWNQTMTPAPLPPALRPALSCVEERRRRTMGSEHPPLFQSWLWVHTRALLRVMCKWPWSLRA